MRITAVKVAHVRGVMSTDGPFWEQRLVRPIDIYPRYRDEARLPEGGVQLSDRQLQIESHFLEIETDQGVSGISGPFSAGCAWYVANQLRPILMGQDPRASEYLWDVMHRLLVHGRQGEAMFAISVVDCALWDLKGKWLGQPVWRILGGPTRTRIPVYASMLGYEVLDPAKVEARAMAYKEKGFKAQKWFFRHGPQSGHEGLRKNVELVRTLRRTLGDDYDIMLDCWQSMDFPYLLALAERIEEFRPFWIEEVAMPDRIDTYKRIKDKVRIPLAGAEHDYTRWGMKRFLDAGALDYYQPDPYWCGGLSETLKIGALTTTHDVICIPHGHSTPVNLVYSALQSPIMTPYQEYLVKWNDVHQFWFEEPIVPIDGHIELRDAPGISPKVAWDKIERLGEL